MTVGIGNGNNPFIETFGSAARINTETYGSEAKNGQETWGTAAVKSTEGMGSVGMNGSAPADCGGNLNIGG